MKAEEKRKDGLSGKYYFHSLYKNIGAYIRSGEVEGFSHRQFFLVYKRGYWIITDDYASSGNFLWDKDVGYGHVCIETEGNKKEYTVYWRTVIQDHEK